MIYQLKPVYYGFTSRDFLSNAYSYRCLFCLEVTMWIIEL